jgi:hypothetical protein
VAAEGVDALDVQASRMANMTPQDWPDGGPDPTLSWRLLSGPVFGNAVATPGVLGSEGRVRHREEQA